jgi:hypothetical protein
MLGAAAYGCVYFVCTGSARKLQQSERPELAWLKEEFKLSDAEFQRVSELHRAYLPQCAEMCRRVAAENEKLQTLLGTQTNVTPQIEQTLAEAARLRAECQTRMLRHFYEVSHTMPAEEGRRYLEWVREKAFASDHDMATTHTEALRDSAHEHISDRH